MKNAFYFLVVLGGALALIACSEGGSVAPRTSVATTPAAPPPPPPPPSSNGPTWMAGIFEASSRFEDRCEVVRSGVDIEGNVFPDLAGSLLEEKFWLRSWTDETYLWNDEVVDRDPASFNDKLAYFDVLRTTETTASGEDKDDFHFSEPTTDFLSRRNSAASAGYGVSFVALSTTAPQDFRVRYTEPNSPASALTNGMPNFVRGTRVLEVDGIDLINGGATQAELDILNNGLFPETAGEMHTFVVRDPGASSTRSVVLVSRNLSSKPVNRFSVIDTPSGRVGYILFNTFSPFESEQDITDTISNLSTQGVDDLVLDLRYNGGGLLAVASQLAYMVAGDAPTRGRTFELLRFNSDAGNFNPVTGEFNEPIPFYDEGLGFSVTAGSPLPSLNLRRVFVLATERTCSASEAVINGLRGIDIEVILIGDTTCGKPFGFYPTDNCGETYYTIQFQGVNDKGFGDYTDGFIASNSNTPFGERLPGCVASDDLDKELGDQTEELLATALQFRETGVCPAIASAQSVRKGQYVMNGSGGIATTSFTSTEDRLQQNRDMTLPGKRR